MSIHMKRAIELAQQAAGRVSPNPAVGAVVVKDGVVVGEGCTSPPGGPHAEVVALRMAGAQAEGASMYVSLEPCSTYGKTPPCTRAIIAAGIRAVHIAIDDPNPLHRGRAREELEAAGISVQTGELAAAATELNEAFFKWVQTRLPFVIAKYAMTLDGKIATRTGHSRWVSSQEARQEVHRLRSAVDAVLVGSGTVIADDPELTARPPYVPQRKLPRRIVADSTGRIPLSARILQGPETRSTVIVTTERSPADFRRSVAGAGAEVVVVDESAGGADLAQMLAALGQMEITSLLAEGGSALLGSLFDRQLIDKVVAFIAPSLVGGNEAPSPISGQGLDKMEDAVTLKDSSVSRCGPDIMVVGYPRWE